MVRRAFFLAAQLLLVAFAGACSVPPEPESPRIDTAVQLVAALREAGAEVKETAILPLRAGLAGGQVVFVGPEQVEIYQFETETARQAVATRWMEEEAEVLGSTDGVLSVWAKGRILVLYRGFDGGLVALLSGLLGDPLTLPRGAVVEPYPPAVAAAVGWLAEALGLDPGELIVLDYAPAEWPDACLGLPGPYEICAGVITPGWHIVLEAGDDEHRVRTDELGTVIREEP